MPIIRLAVICAILCATVLPSNAQQQKKSAGSDQSITNPAPSSTSVPTATVPSGVGNAPAVIQQTCTQEKSNDLPQILTGMGLILVGAAGVWVGLRTLSKIEIQATAANVAAQAAVDMLVQVKEQAASTEKAAIGAQLTAKAAVNAERAWLTPTIEQSDRSKPLGSYELIGKNDGKTPARVIGIAYGSRFIPRKEGNMQPLGTEEPTKTNVWIIGGETKIIETFSILNISWNVPGEEQTAADKFILHGWVDYVAVIEHDAISAPPIHRTTFYYEWDPNSTSLGHKPTYTSYT